MVEAQQAREHYDCRHIARAISQLRVAEQDKEEAQCDCKHAYPVRGHCSARVLREGVCKRLQSRLIGKHGCSLAPHTAATTGVCTGRAPVEIQLMRGHAAAAFCNVFHADADSYPATVPRVEINHLPVHWIRIWQVRQ
eukprot:1478915-Rhodomonas_salina.1